MALLHGILQAVPDIFIVLRNIEDVQGSSDMLSTTRDSFMSLLRAALKDYAAHYHKEDQPNFKKKRAPELEDLVHIPPSNFLRFPSAISTHGTFTVRCLTYRCVVTYFIQ